MRTTISTILMICTAALLVFTVLNGIKIGAFEILSIYDLVEKNADLNKKIEEASTLTSINYPDNVKTLEETYENFQIQKRKYEDLVNVSGGTNSEIYETKQYDIGYLWRVLGKYAEKRSVTLALDVKKDGIGENSYNFNFSVIGRYVDISRFITDIENDSDLYFRIYNFQISGLGEIITATFSVRNVNIDPSTIS